LNFALGLGATAAKAGVSIYERTRAVSFEGASQVTVRTRSPSFPAAPSFPAKADPVLSWTEDGFRLRGNDERRRIGSAGGALPSPGVCAAMSTQTPGTELARRIMGVGTTMVATEILGESRARALSPTMRQSAIRTGTGHFRRSAGSSFVFGGRVSYAGLNPAGTAPITRARLLRVFPQLQTSSLILWGGFVDITLNRAPDFGGWLPNVYFLQAFPVMGWPRPRSRQLIAEATAGAAERFDLFNRISHHGSPAEHSAPASAGAGHAVLPAT